MLPHAHTCMMLGRLQEEVAMSVHPTWLASPVAGAPERRRRLVGWATLLACCTVVASAGWGLAMWTVASALRPAQLKSATYTAQVPAAAAAALVQMRIILLATFAAIVVLAALAILVGRRALRVRVSAQALARLGLGHADLAFAGHREDVRCLQLAHRMALAQIQVDLDPHH